jgi:formate hydrogenlyase subunit 3/multisubunit Na+/H+ antiporter MnhD subunit
MSLLLPAICLIVSAGMLSALFGRWPRLAVLAGAGGAVAGCLAGLVPAIGALLGAPMESIEVPWSLPGGALAFGLDPLSGLFLSAVFALGGLSACYGAGYFVATSSRPAVGAGWLWFNILIASMAVVVCAQNAVLFLVAWEGMTISSFFLVTWEDGEAANRRAGWTYLVAAHIGTACLIVFFTGLSRSTGGFALVPGIHGAPAHAGLLFVMALAGFGTKAGFVPLHVWLPEAHPAAPSHVSALMSGVMIKMGIYGLLRAMTLLGPWQEWWGWVLLGVGISSGLLGVLNALAQHDLKRLLAYHSVENIGIIALGIGLGVIAEANGIHGAAVLAFAGALLHVLNHATFKGLLFLGAGAVVQGAGTRHLESLGGLLKRMPWTGATFIIGAVAISGLPPFNGFVSEFLVFLGSIRVFPGAGPVPVIAGVITMAGLGMIGALATACFAKVIGVVFLGSSRSSGASGAREAPAVMLAPMVVLAVMCVAGCLASPWMVRLMGAPLGILFAATGNPGPGPDMADGALLALSALSAALFALVAVIVVVRRRLLARRSVTAAGTWDCGYAEPSARMQYTASSFAQPLVSYFNLVLGVEEKKAVLSGYFPRKESFGTVSRDLFVERLFTPLMSRLSGLLGNVRGIQEGHVQLYIAYIAATLVILLFLEVWQ